MTTQYENNTTGSPGAQSSMSPPQYRPLRDEEPQKKADSSGQSRLAKAWSTYCGPRAYLALMLVLLVCCRSVDQVLFYRLNFNFSYFVFYFSSVILPVAYIALTIPVVAYKLLRTDHITAKMRAVPQWKYAVLGLLDATFNILSTFPVQHLGGSMANVLSQTVLPFNMLLSRVLLGTRFSKAHFLGAVLVTYGVLVKLMPDLFGGGVSGGLGWMLLLVGANVFSAASNVFKEAQLKDADMDEWWMNLWVSLWQLLFGALCFWQGYVGAFMDPSPAIGTCDDCTWGTYIANANTCFVGGTVDIPGLAAASCTSDVGAATFDAGSGMCRVDCGGGTGSGSAAPGTIFLAYIVFNIAFNFLMLHCFKLGSSTLFVVANAVRLPVVDLLLMWRGLAGPASQTFTRYDGYALFALCLGTVVFYSEKEEQDSGDGAAAAAGNNKGDVEEGKEGEGGGEGILHMSVSPLQGVPSPPSQGGLLEGDSAAGDRFPTRFGLPRSNSEPLLPYSSTV